MGKRELLLVAVFVVLGFVVYQFAAPPADPNRPGWSVAGIIERMQREIRGNQAQSDSTKTSTIPAPAALREILIGGSFSQITITGEERADIQAELNVNSRAYDEAEAKRTAEQSHLTIDQTADRLILGLFLPREGRQRAAVSVKVPSRLAVLFDEKGAALTVKNVASVTMGGGRGQTIISDIAGPVQVMQRGNSIVITNVGSVKLNTFSVEARVSKVRGAATLTLQGGEALAEEIEGAIEIDARNCELKLERLEKNRTSIKINSSGGEIFLAGVQADTRIDGRRTEVRVEQAAAAPLAIYNDGETVEVAVAPDGFAVDAVVTDGRISLDGPLEKAGLKVTESRDASGDGPRERRESRVTGSVRGGGPTITVRSARADIVLRSRN